MTSVAAISAGMYTRRSLAARMRARCAISIGIVAFATLELEAYIKTIGLLKVRSFGLGSTAWLGLSCWWCSAALKLSFPLPFLLLLLVARVAEGYSCLSATRGR